MPSPKYSPAWFLGKLPASVREPIIGLQQDARPIRADQVRQWFHPEENILPKTNLRPQSLTKFTDQVFRGAGNENLPWGSEIETPADLVGKSPKELKKFGGIIPSRGLISSTPDKNISGFTLPEALGMGRARTSIGLDEETHQPFMSTFDSWDFAEDSPFQDVMEGGKPYNIYQRFPMKLDEKGNFTNTFPVTVGRGDINLPKDKKKKSGIGPSWEK